MSEHGECAGQPISETPQGDNVEGQPRGEAVAGPAATDDVVPGTLEELRSRLAALERTITDEDVSLPDLEDEATVQNRLDTMESELEALTDRVTELEAATRALRGYASGIDAVNEDVERRADLALSKVEALERAHADGELRVERLESLPDSFESTCSSSTESACSSSSESTFSPSTEEPAETNDPNSEISEEPVVGSDDKRRSLAARLRDVV